MLLEMWSGAAGLGGQRLGESLLTKQKLQVYSVRLTCTDMENLWKHNDLNTFQHTCRTTSMNLHVSCYTP